MRKLLVYLRAYLRESILGPLLKLMEAALDLIVPLVVAAVIDHGIAAADHSYILKMCFAADRASAWRDCCFRSQRNILPPKQR